MTTDATPREVGSHAGLGLAPERAGQARLMLLRDEDNDDLSGHWYSPAAVREMLAAERERCAKALSMRAMQAANAGDAVFAQALRVCESYIRQLGPNVRANRPSGAAQE